jgi:hypothetical protein
MTDKIEVHHIRALKDLEKYTGREKPQWGQIMAARRRKTLDLPCGYSTRTPTQTHGITLTDSFDLMMLES